jgi:UDP-N-acetylglucosamine acyltransferase
MIQGGTMLGQDVPPYIIVSAEGMSYAGINKVGLSRRGFTSEQIATIHDVCRVLFQSDLNYMSACEKAMAELPASPERDYLVAFIRTSQRGVIKPYRSRR